MYASEAELNEVEKQLKDHSVIPFNLQAQIEGTFSFTNAGFPIDIEANIEKAGYRLVERVTLEGRNSEYTIQPATEPTAAAQGEGESWGVNPTERELVAYGDGYASGLMDGPEYAPLKNEIIALQAALQQAQRERDAYAVALNAVFVNVEPALIEVAGIHEENMSSDKRALFRVFRIVDGALQASAQQAANAEGGAAWSGRG